jgi:hypothetical protein
MQHISNQELESNTIYAQPIAIIANRDNANYASPQKILRAGLLHFLNCSINT